MSEGGIFPLLHDGSSPEEPWDHRFQPLAEILNCSNDEAGLAFRGLVFPEYGSREHLDAVKEGIDRLNRTIKPAERLLRRMRELSDDELDGLRYRGAVTVEQIEHLLDVLTGEAESLKGWYSGHSRKGGRNVAAHTIAEGVRRAFRRQRAKITYGEAEGRPTTEFGRAVEKSLAAFGIRADWSDPAYAAWQRQRGYERTLAVWKARREKRARGAS